MNPLMIIIFLCYWNWAMPGLVVCCFLYLTNSTFKLINGNMWILDNSSCSLLALEKFSWKEQIQSGNSFTSISCFSNCQSIGRADRRKWWMQSGKGLLNPAHMIVYLCKALFFHKYLNWTIICLTYLCSKYTKSTILHICLMVFLYMIDIVVMPIVRKRVRGPIWLHFLVGVSSMNLFISG